MSEGLNIPLETINGVLPQRPAPATPAATATVDGTDPLDFVRANRIQIKNGSLFVDPYLVVHPRELDPANEAALRKKLELTYSINNPSFFEDPSRTAVALNLGQLIPVSLAAKRSKLLEEVKKFNEEVKTGTDAALAKELEDKKHPFAAIVRDTTQTPEADPVGMELLKNSLAVYLLCREKLTQNNYLGKLTDYTPRLRNTDQVLTDLADKIGVTPRQMREAALKGGIDGVGQLLGLDPKYIADVKALTAEAASKDFSYNILEHWHIGRQLDGIDAPMAQKIATGQKARIDAKIDELRREVKHHYDVPEPVKNEERRIAQALSLVDPIQRKLMYRLGYEICFTPEVTADGIAFYPGVFGLHRKAANNLNDTRGTYRIYFSGRGDLEGSMRTLVHEIAHNFWPNELTKEQTAQIDRYLASDAERFRNLNRLVTDKFPEFEKLLKAFQAGDEKEKAAVLASADELFKPYGVTASGVMPYLNDAFEFQYLVKHAQDTLDIEGERYSRSGYDSPQERCREVLARFAELKQVRLRGAPQLLHYIAPGLDDMFETIYLPHLQKVYAELGNAPAQTLADEQPKVKEEAKVKEQPLAGGVQNASVTASPNGVALGGGFAHNTRTLSAMNVLSQLHGAALTS